MDSKTESSEQINHSHLRGSLFTFQGSRVHFLRLLMIVGNFLVVQIIHGAVLQRPTTAHEEATIIDTDYADGMALLDNS